MCRWNLQPSPTRGHRRGREQQSVSHRQPPEPGSTAGPCPWLSFSPGWSPRRYLAITSGSCRSTNSCMHWCSVDLSRKRWNDWRYLSGSASKLLMGDAMLGVGRVQEGTGCSLQLFSEAWRRNEKCWRGKSSLHPDFAPRHQPCHCLGALHNLATEAVNGVQAAKGNISSLIWAELVPAFFNCADTGLC